MPNPHKPIWERGRKNRPPKTPLTTKVKKLIMNGTLDKLKSRKLWIAVLGSALVTIGSELGLSDDTVQSLVAILAAYLLGQGLADHGKSAVLIICGLLALSSPTQAGVALDDPKPITLPELPPAIENPSWLDRGNIWTFAWVDTGNGDNGAGVRLGYEVTENIRIRFDYLVESFDFAEGVIADQSEGTLSMRYELFPKAQWFPYLIAGGGSASLSSFEWEYLIGGGVDYEFTNGVTAFAEFIHIRSEADGFSDRNEIRAGVGVDLSVFGKLPIPFLKK
tara:strand:+ start:4190 stop:5023 length:834 start_codon:yes stop_codon:yes gene_type:complete